MERRHFDNNSTVPKNEQVNILKYIIPSYMEWHPIQREVYSCFDAFKFEDFIEDAKKEFNEYTVFL